MKYCLITFRSVTFAQRAEQLLRKMGYGCTLQRTPRWMQEQGCGYSLRLKSRDAMACALLLRENQLTYQKAYSCDEGGYTQELRL